jgi:hypothetical protein
MPYFGKVSHAPFLVKLMEMAVAMYTDQICNLHHISHPMVYESSQLDKVILPSPPGPTPFWTYHMLYALGLLPVAKFRISSKYEPR